MSYERYAWLCNQGEVWIPERTVEEEIEAVNGDQARFRSQQIGPSLGSSLASQLLATQGAQT